VEVFHREVELTLSVSEGENRQISGCLQGQHVLPRDSSAILEESCFPSKMQARAQCHRVIGWTKSRRSDERISDFKLQIADLKI